MKCKDIFWRMPSGCLGLLFIYFICVGWPEKSFIFVTLPHRHSTKYTKICNLIGPKYEFRLITQIQDGLNSFDVYCSRHETKGIEIERKICLMSVTLKWRSFFLSRRDKTNADFISCSPTKAYPHRGSSSQLSTRTATRNCPTKSLSGNQVTNWLLNN